MTGTRTPKSYVVETACRDALVVGGRALLLAGMLLAVPFVLAAVLARLAWTSLHADDHRAAACSALRSLPGLACRGGSLAWAGLLALVWLLLDLTLETWARLDRPVAIAPAAPLPRLVPPGGRWAPTRAGQVRQLLAMDATDPDVPQAPRRPSVEEWTFALARGVADWLTRPEFDPAPLEHHASDYRGRAAA